LIRTIVQLLLTFTIALFLIVIIGSINVVSCEGIELVNWGQQGTLGPHFGTRFTAIERAYWVTSNVPSYLKGAIIGLLISDAYIRIVKGGVNAYLQFCQSVKNSKYFWFVFSLLGPIIQALPKYSILKHEMET